MIFFSSFYVFTFFHNSIRRDDSLAYADPLAARENGRFVRFSTLEKSSTSTVVPGTKFEKLSTCWTTHRHVCSNLLSGRTVFHLRSSRFDAPPLLEIHPKSALP